MNSQMYAVMQRRGELLARIASQRGQMGEFGARLQAPLALADRGLAVARFLRSNPVLVAGVIGVLVIRRRGVVGAASAIWRVWRRYRYFLAVAKKLSS
jgi:hypothetical protein